MWINEAVSTPQSVAIGSFETKVIVLFLLD